MRINKAIEEAMGFDIAPMDPGRALDNFTESPVMDIALEHELSALLDVLGHNLRLIGYPIDSLSDSVRLDIWNNPLEDMTILQK